MISAEIATPLVGVKEGRSCATERYNIITQIHIRHHSGCAWSNLIPTICLETGSGCKHSTSFRCFQDGRNQAPPSPPNLTQLLLHRGVSPDHENHSTAACRGLPRSELGGGKGFLKQRLLDPRQGWVWEQFKGSLKQREARTTVLVLYPDLASVDLQLVPFLEWKD